MLGWSVADPGRYGSDIRILRAMGWSWSDLQNSPADLIDELRVRLDAEAHWTAERRKLDESKGK